MVRPRAAASASARALRWTVVVPSKMTSAPRARAPSTLTDGARGGHHDDSRAAELAGGQRHRQTVIAGREGDDTACPIGSRQLQEHVRGAPDLEGAAALEVLAFQPQRLAVSGEFGGVDEGCDARHAPNAGGGFTNQLERDKSIMCVAALLPARALTGQLCHLNADASRRAALLVACIFPICALLTPGRAAPRRPRWHPIPIRALRLWIMRGRGATGGPNRRGWSAPVRPRRPCRRR